MYLAPKKLITYEIYEIPQKLGILGFHKGKPDGLIESKTKNAHMGEGDNKNK